MDRQIGGEGSRQSGRLGRSVEPSRGGIRSDNGVVDSLHVLGLDYLRTAGYRHGVGLRIVERTGDYDAWTPGG